DDEVARTLAQTAGGTDGLLGSVVAHDPDRVHSTAKSNGKAERLLGSIRRELLDHVIVYGEGHLRMLLRKYIDYYNADRCHLALGKDPPKTREVMPRPSETATVVSLPRVGGIHHRYEWRNAA
ncbi:MAG TPA: integrase core domain-containing protein, partial [Myxococcota bacterium]|nr:integrase core domain-containing protein [Myxococcota bacterium]